MGIKSSKSMRLIIAMLVLALLSFGTTASPRFASAEELTDQVTVFKDTSGD